MRPKTLIKFLIEAVKKRMPVLVKSKPGCGKSDIVAQVAKLISYDLIISHPVVSEPTDFKGLPFAKPNATIAEFLPYGDLARILNAVNPTIWFLDDLGQAPPSVQAALMQALLAREINGVKIPECVTFIAATNEREGNMGVRGILAPVIDRFGSIVELTVNGKDWCDWAIGANLEIPIIAYIRMDESRLHKYKPITGIEKQPSPRTWAIGVDPILKMNLPKSIEIEALKGAIGEAEAIDFSNFMAIYRQMPSIDAILTNPAGVTIPKDPGPRYLIATGLALKANSRNIANIITFCERMHQDNHGDFAAITMRDCVRRNEELANTGDYLKRVVHGPIGALIDGTWDDE